MTDALTIRETKAIVVSTPLDENPAAVYLSSLAKGSRRTMRQALDDIAAMLSNGRADAFSLDWAALRFQHTNAIRSKLAEKHSAATANKMLCALRGVLLAAFNLGTISAEDYLRAKTLKPVKGNSLPTGRALSDKEVRSLFETCASPELGDIRDCTMLAVMYSCGLRRSEVIALDVNDFNESDNSLTVRRGKGNKTRLVYLADGALKWVRDWLRVRGDSGAPLFVPVLKNGRVVTEQRMTSQSVWFALQKRADQAGIKDVSPHDFRRTFISVLLDRGVDVSTVQKLAGHANIQTTLRYDRRDETAKSEAIKSLRVPYEKCV